jgi:hypothetical protein
MIDFIGLYKTELIAAMANLAASTEATAPGIGGNMHYLRSLAIGGSESAFGQSVRSPSNRSNAYFAPGELNNMLHGGLLAANCDNVNNQSQTGFALPNVPCKVQPGFRWGGLTRYFPHVTSGSSQ